MPFVIRDAVPGDRLGVTETVVEAFYKDLQHVHRDKAVLVQLLYPAMHPERFVVAALPTGAVVGVVGLSDAAGYAITPRPRDVLQTLGVMRGTLVLVFLKPELERPRRFEQGQGHVDFVAVREAARNNGLAGRMLRYVLAKPDYRVFTLEVVEGNEHVLPLYRAAGFVDAGRTTERHARMKGFSFRYQMRYAVPGKT